jgi:hypothetical protein
MNEENIPNVNPSNTEPEKIEKIEEIETLREAAFALKPEIKDRLLNDVQGSLGSAANASILLIPKEKLAQALLPIVGIFLAGLAWLFLKDLCDDNVLLMTQLAKRDLFLRIGAIVLGGFVYLSCAHSERQGLQKVRGLAYLTPFLGLLGTLPFSHAFMGEEMGLGRGWLLGGAVALAALLLGIRRSLAGTLGIMSAVCATIVLLEHHPERALLGAWLGFLLTYLIGSLRFRDSVLPALCGLLVVGSLLLSPSPLYVTLAILLLALGSLVLLFVQQSKQNVISGAEEQSAPSIFAILLILCGVTAANQLLPRIGGMAVVLLMTLVLPLFSRTLALRLLPFALMLALYKLLPNGNRLGSLTDQYALFGIVLGAALPLGLTQIQEKLGSNKWVGLLALVLLIGFAPFTLVLLFGTKCLLALHIGLTLGVAYRAVHKSNADLSVLVAFGISLVAITFAPQWSEWVAEFTRADRLKWLVGIALGVGVLVAYSEKKSR